MSTVVTIPKGNGTRTTMPAVKPAAKPVEKPVGDAALLDQAISNTETKWTKATAFRPFGSDEEITLTAGSVQQFLCRPTKNGAKPSFEDCIKFVLLCKSRKLNPWVGDAFMVGYDGKDGPEFNLITSHQAFLKRAEVHKEYDGMASGVIVSNGEEIMEMEGDFFPDGYSLLGAWATVYFKNRSHPMRKRIKLSTFNKGRSVWQSNPAGMIVKCAEADALRSSFPTELGGLYLQGEVQSDEPVVSAHPAPANHVTKRLVARIRGDGSYQPSVPTDEPQGESESPVAKQDQPINPQAKHAEKPAAEAWEQATNDQLDEIDAAMLASGWTVNEVLAGLKASNGTPVVSLGQISKAHAADVLKRMYASINDKGE